MKFGGFGIVAVLQGLLLFPLTPWAYEGGSPNRAYETESPSGTFKDDPAAHALYNKMLDKIRGAETLYYESDYQRGTQDSVWSHCTYKIWMKKPNYVRLEAKSRLSNSEGVLVGDGEYFWIYWPTGRPYTLGTDWEEYSKTRFTSYVKMHTPQGRHSIAHEIDRLGVGTAMTILEPSIFHGYEDPMQPYLDRVRGLGVDTVGGEECDVIEASFMDHQRNRYFWVSRIDYLPRKSKEIVRVKNDIITQELWFNVHINGEILPHTFAWEPPEGWSQYREQSMEERLLKTGVTAPDFELTSSAGKKIRLSDYRGNLVWLIFWRVGCQGCREGLIYARDIWKKYASSGLVVIGFNCADKKSIASSFIRKISIGFPNIMDGSAEAQRIFYGEYQKPGMSAVPLNYLIDREGRIESAWYGIEDNDKHVAEVLRGMR